MICKAVINKPARSELRCHLAADGTNPVLRRIVVVRDGKDIRQAQPGIQGAKTIRAFCIGLLYAKYRSTDTSLGTGWTQLALGAPRNTWAATLVENLCVDKDPVWWREMQQELGLKEDSPFRLKDSPFRLTEYHDRFNIAYNPDSKDGDAFWSIGRLRLFLGDDEKDEITGDHLNWLASEWERQETSWDPLPLQLLNPKNHLDDGRTSPLRGDLDVLWLNPMQRRISIATPGSLPLPVGTGFQLHATLTKPAFVYLLWLGSDGVFQPLYPWAPPLWETYPPEGEQKKIESLKLPFAERAGVEFAWSIKGPPGLETVILLADDLAKPRYRVDELRDRLALATSPTIDLHVDPTELHRLDLTEPAPLNRLRSIDLNPRRILDPIGDIHSCIRTTLSPYFKLVVALTFPTAEKQ